MAEDLPPMSEDHTKPASPKGETDSGQPPFAVGDMAGKYRILKKLSGGGMGAVYLAWDSALDRQVAIKVPFTVSSSDWQRQQIQGEIEALVKLDHPGIVRVFDFFTVRDYPCIVMAYVEGVTLDQYARRSSLSYRAIAELVLQLAEAMAHAHARNVVHRDLKPLNIIIRHDGRAVVTDFGLAYIRSAYAEQGVTGAWGTPDCKAPEQTKGDPKLITTRTDVFGLGSVLYYLLTGQSPYPGDDPNQRKRVEAAQFRLPRAGNESIPAALEKICLKAMAGDPANRYASMEEFADALRVYLKATTESAAVAVPVLTASLEIHFQRANERGLLHILSERTVPVRTGDRIQIHAQLGTAAHSCLIHVDPACVVSVLHPSGNNPSTLLDRLSVPTAQDLWLPLTAPAGTETILLVVDSKPVDVSNLIDIVKCALSGICQMPAIDELVTFTQNGRLREFKGALGEFRSFAQPEISDPIPLLQLRQALFREYYAVSGISFPHVKG